MLKLWREWVKPILVVVIVCGAFRSAVADWNDVPTGSMKPTIIEGDRILVNKLAYDLKIPFTRWRIARWSEPRRGDVVVCFSPHDGTRLVKRVVGVPGDHLAMRNNRLFVNGVPAVYQQLDAASLGGVDPPDVGMHRLATETLGGDTHPIMLSSVARAARTFGEITVPPAAFFVMGDNRDESADSRVFGFVRRRDIVGRAWAVAYSLDLSHWYMPRLNRVLHSLQ